LLRSCLATSAKCLVGVLAVGLTLACAPAQAGEVSFAGKQIKLSIGFSSTGYGYDTYGRLLARHLGKHLPGNPVILPQNRPGAGSLNLANYIYNAAPRDGSEIAIVGRGVAMEPLIGASASQGKFDSRKLVWLGSMNNEVSGFFIGEGAPATNLKEILAGTPLKVGSTGAAGDQQAFTIALNSLLGAKLKPIAGYPGTQEILLAVERGELDGIVGYSWGVARAGHKEALASGRLKVVMQLGLEKHKELPDVPMLEEFVHAPQDRQVLELIFSRQSMGRPLIAPPGLDPGIAELLRQAFADAMHDPQLIAEAAKMDLELGFVSGADVQGMVERLYRSPPDVVARAQVIAAGNI
jgi:tripartite-type tricarboxylate transporter receptor subunit TctC